MPGPSQTGRDFEDFVATAGKEPIGSCGWQGALRRGASERRQRADSRPSLGPAKRQSCAEGGPWFRVRRTGAAVEISGIVSCDLTNQGADRAQLLPLIDQIKANTEVLLKQVSADAGYASDANLKGLEERDIDGFVAAGRQKHGTAAPAAGKAKEGSRLAAMAQKIAGQGYDSPYRLRKQTVEPVFGQIKQARGFRQLLLRGLDKVKQEWVLVCTAHNLLKLTAFG